MAQRAISWRIQKDRPAEAERWDRDTFDRLALFGCLTVGLICGIAQATGFITDPFDAHMYWNANVPDLYPVTWDIAGGYVYPPPMALVVNFLHPLGWPLFIAGFTTASWWAFWYLTRALALPVLLASWMLAPLVGGNVIGYLFMGNVQLLMAAAIVASIRGWPGWTAVPLLTKIVGIPLVWWAVRREWRNLAIALGATAAVVVVTALVSPESWEAFVRFLTTNTVDTSPVPMVPIPLPVRLVAAVLLTGWGGLTNRRWTVMIAAGLAIPALYQWSYLALWIGVIGIEWSSRPRPADRTSGSQ